MNASLWHLTHDHDYSRTNHIISMSTLKFYTVLRPTIAYVPIRADVAMCGHCVLPTKIIFEYIEEGGIRLISQRTPDEQKNGKNESST